MFMKFPKIQQLRQVIKSLKYYSDQRTSFTFVGQPKLHGTNACIIVGKDNKVKGFQSRNRKISVDDDQFNFCQEMSNVPDLGIELRSIVYQADEYDDLYFYGEWCGTGVQKGVALSELEKRFVVFSVCKKVEVEAADGYNYLEEVFVWGSPEISNSKLDTIWSHELSKVVNIDLDNLSKAVEEMQNLTLQFEEECPYSAQFGVSGIGEGLVWKCVDEGFDTPRYWFKTKGDKHSVSKVKHIKNLDVAEMNKIEEFCNATVTENRLNQAIDYLKEMNIDLDVKTTGDFIKWVVKDIQEEEGDLIQQHGLNVKKVKGQIGKLSREFYHNKLDEIF